jgi:hypothetical protein
MWGHVVDSDEVDAISTIDEALESRQISRHPATETKKARGYGLSLVAPTGIELLIEDAD